MKDENNVDNINVAFMLTYQHKCNIDTVPLMLPNLCFLFFFFLKIFFWEKFTYSNFGNNVAFMLICQHKSNLSGGGVVIIEKSVECARIEPRVTRLEVYRLNRCAMESSPWWQAFKLFIALRGCTHKWEGLYTQVGVPVYYSHKV